ncbi:MAG: glycosyltransferase family 39 protein [Hyphomonadaceae bacterium]|nr:glycosyltransferase family 39 protein [Hyphomonadaceae bacterium]
MSNVGVSKRTNAWVLGIGATILLAAFLVRLIGIDGRWMWFDELLSASYITHDIPQTLLANLRFDVHPPLYYLQLNLWSMFGDSDLWLMLNSVLWSVLAVALLMWRVRRLYDLQTAWIAGVLLAFASAALFYGDQVRMYAFLMVVMLWAWIAMDDWLKADRNGRFPWKVSLNVIASQTAVVYSHSAGIVMISGCVLYGAVELLRAGDLRTRIYWLVSEACVGVLSLYALALAAFRTTTHPVAPGIDDFINTWRFLAAGELGPQAIGVVMGFVLLGALVWLGVTQRDKRVGILTLVFAPLLASGVVSYVKPIWLDRIFVPVVPFLCLYVALFGASLLKTKRITAIAIAASVAALWVGVGTWGQAVRHKGDGYKPAAAYVREIAKPGDTVLVDGDFSYWCFMWYFAGRHWGYPQEAIIILPKWQALADKVGPDIAHLLGFNEQKRNVDVGGVNALMWDREAPVAINTHTVLAVRGKAAEPLNLPGFTLADTHAEHDLLVETWRKAVAP